MASVTPRRRLLKKDQFRAKSLALRKGNARPSCKQVVVPKPHAPPHPTPPTPPHPTPPHPTPLRLTAPHPAYPTQYAGAEDCAAFVSQVTGKKLRPVCVGSDRRKCAASERQT